MNQDSKLASTEVVPSGNESVKQGTSQGREKKSEQESVANVNEESTSLHKNNKHPKVSKEIKEQFTAAFTTIRVDNKTICTFADSSASVIAFTWVKYLKMEDLIKPSNIWLVNAQKESIPVRSEITLPVEFGRKVFQWTFAVVDSLFCLANYSIERD